MFVILNRNHFAQVVFRRFNNYRSAYTTEQINRRQYSHKPAYCHIAGKDPLVYTSLGQQLQRAVQKYGDRTALLSCHEGVTLSFEQARSQAEHLAVHLQELGLQRGQHLGIWAPNTSQWYVTFLAAALAGFPLVCINPALQAPELEYALKKAKVRTLITMEKHGKQDFEGVLRRLLPELTTGKKAVRSQRLPDLQAVIIKSEGPLDGVYNYDELMQEIPSKSKVQHLNNQLDKISPESACNIQFTSGTTGQPKATVLTHFGFVNAGRNFGTRICLNEGHKRICVTVPYFHVFGLATITSALDYGATMVLPSASFDSFAALEVLERERCNIVLGTPTMYVDMLEKQRILQKSLESLEIAVCGGATCSPDLFIRIIKELHTKRGVRVGYGLSEATAALFTHLGNEPLDEAVHTVGSLYDHAEAKVINELGETVRFGEPGELCLRGYFTMKSYFEDEQKTLEVLGQDGWLRTGDKFVLEASGVGRVVGRIKDMVVRGGENIFPKEIEDLLDAHEDIIESQVVGVPDERMGEELCAFLRLRDGAKILTADDLKLYFQGKLAYFKIPRYVRVLEAFPKTTSGKVQKFKLREMFDATS